MIQEADKDGLRFSLGCLVQFAIAILGLFASVTVAWYQSRDGDFQAVRTEATARELAEMQRTMALHLDQQEQWRKTPKMEVLLVQQTDRNETNCIVQNTGGRDLVVYSIDLEVITPLNELKGNPTSTRKPSIQVADRSKVEKIDLAMQDFERENVFNLDPAVIVKPGESLTLKFVFPLPSIPHILNARSNAGRTYLFHSERSR